MTTPDQDPPDRLRVGGWLPPPKGGRHAADGPETGSGGGPPVIPYPAPALPDDLDPAVPDPKHGRRRRRVPVTVLVGAAAVAVVAVLATTLTRGGDPTPTADATTTPAPPTQATTGAGSGAAPTSSSTPQPTSPPPSSPPAGSPSPTVNGPLTLTYEAETALLIGATDVLAQAQASGGKVVHQVGTDSAGTTGALAFNRVTVPRAGRYALTVDYLTDEPRNTLLTVNDDRPLLLRFPSTGGWTTVGAQTFTIELRAGTNRLGFTNPGGWAPRFDKISLLG